MQKITVSFRVYGDPEEAKAAVREALQMGCTLADGSLAIRGYTIEKTEPLKSEATDG